MKEAYNAFAGCLQAIFVTDHGIYEIPNSKHQIPNIGIFLLFEICYLEFPLTQLLREWISIEKAIGDQEF